MSLQDKICSWDEMAIIARNLHAEHKKLVFTNGCFDILHAGHVAYLHDAKAEGDVLIVGLNSDESVRRLKGETRPVNQENARAFVLAGLAAVDFVVIFEQDTPLELITLLQPDVLVKGGDWCLNDIVGSDIVLSKGGVVKSLQFRDGFSTTETISQIQKYTIS
jgi:D-beta-D-heptose 7-phosphate kinase/D-beta-D-heptose 1-phosphate adenosyltransferase